MAIDDRRLVELQCDYLASRNPNTLYLLQQEIEKVARPLVKITVRKRGGYIGQQRLEEVAYDSSIRLMEMFLKDTNWKCTSWQSRIILEILFHLYGKAQQKIDREVPYDDAIDSSIKYEAPEKESTRETIEDIMEHPYWRNIIRDCYGSRYYSIFLKKIAVYVKRDWIESHILRLRDLFAHTRK